MAAGCRPRALVFEKRACGAWETQGEWALSRRLGFQPSRRYRRTSEVLSTRRVACSGTQNPPILVVDDDPDILKLLGVALRLDGFRVIAASDSGEALQMVREERPALVVLDIMMPGVDGYTVCRTVRGFSDVPIVMLTAKGGVDDIVHGLDLGADDYVVKPFNVNELAARVKRVLHRTRLPQETQQTMFVCRETLSSTMLSAW